MSFLEYKIKYVLLVILDNSLAVKKKLGSHFSRADSREIMSGAGATSKQDGSESPKPWDESLVYSYTWCPWVGGAEQCCEGVEEEGGAAPLGEPAPAPPQLGGQAKGVPQHDQQQAAKSFWNEMQTIFVWHEECFLIDLKTTVGLTFRRFVHWLTRRHFVIVIQNRFYFLWLKYRHCIFYRNGFLTYCSVEVDYF